MSDRTKFILQKRTSLKSQITGLYNTLDKGTLDDSTLKLRITRLTQLYHAFEEFNDELAILDSNDEHQIEFSNIQERFYSLAGKIDAMLNNANSSSAASTSSAGNASNDENQVAIAQTSASNKRLRIKLPQAPLPTTFDGKFEGWLSFRNAFHSMIGSQTDLSDIDKLHYLKSAFIGDAANKIKILEIDGINYNKAWESLERSYEVKRILVSRHLSMIMNLPVLDKETANGLSKLADDAQQHLASLAALGVNVGHEIIVHIPSKHQVTVI